MGECKRECVLDKYAGFGDWLRIYDMRR